MSKQSAYFLVPGLAGRRDVKELKRGVAKIPGVLSVSVNTAEDKVAVDYDSTGTGSGAVGEKLRSLGFEVKLIENEDHTM